MSKISLTIDGLTVEVEQGTTILEAARFLGIEIPTPAAAGPVGRAGAMWN